MVALEMHLAGGKKMERRELQVADRVHCPTIVTVRIDIATGSFQSMPIEFEASKRVAAEGRKPAQLFRFAAARFEKLKAKGILFPF